MTVDQSPTNDHVQVTGNHLVGAASLRVPQPPFDGAWPLTGNAVVCSHCLNTTDLAFSGLTKDLNLKFDSFSTVVQGA